MTEQEIRQIVRDEIRQLLVELLNNAWETHEYDDYTVRRPTCVGWCVRDTMVKYLMEEQNDR